MTLSISAKIALSAAASRVLCLSIGLLSARYLHPYDTSGNIYPGAQDGLGRWLSPLAYWDGVYFLRTAEIKGYGYEHTHAFFPGLPIAINLFEGLLPSAMPRMDRLLLSGLLITNISFVVAAVLLYWLGLAVLSGDHAASIAYYGALFFAIPMSNIFMSAIYTESLYCLLTFGGLLLLYSTSKGHHTGALVSSAVLLAAATLTRSNGTLNAPFFVSYGIHNRCILLVIPLVLLIVLPMVVYLHYARSLYCYDGDDLASRPWCSGRGNVYSYIQKEYWHVGLFDYYTPKNIPNFLLAIPSMTIAITAVVRGLLVYCPPLRKALSPKAWLHADGADAVHFAVCKRSSHHAFADRLPSLLLAAREALQRC
ncbi:hypothetical protein FOZ61_007390 [Perkinsus olseni]|uniref:GPI mannosyltransferase 2 n=1 Tax=Perkinsus olseni TaxID=32597 RepID=A0A7J6L962_PEROL|nr:hypothetical protein FOZ61_007390 [Perkinsus olseni]